MFKHIYEHLKTKKKYNKLELHCECLKEDLQEMTLKLNTQKLINQTQREEFEETLDKYIDEIEKLKLKLKEAKRK